MYRPHHRIVQSPDGQFLATYGTGLHIWDAKSFSKVKTLPSPGGTRVTGGTRVMFSHDSKMLLVQGRHRTHIIRVSDGKHLTPTAGHTRMTYRVQFSRDNRALISSNRGEIFTWDARNGEPRHALKATRDGTGVNPEFVNRQWPQLSPDGNDLIILHGNGRILRWDLETGKLAETKLFPNSNKSIFAFSPDGKRFAQVHRVGKKIEVWSVKDRNKIHEFDFPAPESFLKRYIHGIFDKLVFSPDGRYLTAKTAWYKLVIWDLATGEMKLFERQDSVVDVSFSFDSSKLVTVEDLGSDGRFLLAWDLETLKQIGKCKIDRSSSALACAPDTNLAAASTKWGQVDIIDLDTSKKIHSFKKHDAIILGLAFSHDGKRLASISEDTTIIIWDMAPVLRELSRGQDKK